jgi:predicted GH43/DUF377 family glycosyl hydrolase
MTATIHPPVKRILHVSNAVAAVADADLPGVEPLLLRDPANPIVTAEMIPGGASCVFNSGVVRHGREFIMLVNAWDQQWRPRFLVGRSDDGVRFNVEPTSHFTPPGEYPYVRHEGIFDTRITAIEGQCLITYNVASHLGGRIRLARTHDFTAFEDLGFITAPDHRNCVIFPRKIGGDYLRLERPNVSDAGDIYLSRSPDLIHWGQTQLVLERNRRYWESAKIGPGAPPIETDAGWLVIYHGARKGMNGYTYSAGVMLLDREDPSRIVGKCNRVLLEPHTSYERVGITPNVVFPTAAVPVEGDRLNVYYGAADTCMALASGSISGLINACLAAG